MNNLNTETHFYENRKQLAGRLVRDIQTNVGLGKIVVVTDAPSILMKQVSDEWRELAALAPPLRVSDIVPPDIPEADVTFAKVEDLLMMPPICQTLCVASPVENQKLYLISGWMSPGSLVIRYSPPPQR